MHAYQVFKHSEHGFKAVKRGFSWPGFFFTSLWALSRRMWLRGCALFMLEIVLWVMIWETAGNNPFFSLLVRLIYQLYVGINGNSWCGTGLEDQGWAPMGVIRARDARDAVAKVALAGGVIPPELKAGPIHIGFISMPAGLRALFAIVWLTWKAAFRYRLFRVIVTLLLAAVVGLPLLIKHDGTAEGFAQIMLTYTLGSVTALLGFCTLWLACGTLARDVEECQIQMVVVKPVARWQVWLGKWLGLVSLNAALLAVAGLSIYGLLEWRARSLAPEELPKLRNEVLVARGSAKDQSANQFVEQKAEAGLQDLKAKNQLGQADPNKVLQRLRDQVKTGLQLVPPGYVRKWEIKLGAARYWLKGRPLYLRVKFNTAQTGPTSQYDTFLADWAIGIPQKTDMWEDEMSLAPDTFHEFQIGPDLFDDDGLLTIRFRNPNNTALIFTLDEGMEVLYRVGGFGLNFVRGLGIILCWMALLAALGLAAASFLSFPVAAFCCLAALTMVFSSGTLTTVVSEGTVLGTDEESGIKVYSALDSVVVPMFRSMLKVIDLVQQFSPVDALSTGRNVGWGQLALAFAEVVLLLGGILAGFGMFVFTRRELATAQGNH